MTVRDFSKGFGLVFAGITFIFGFLVAIQMEESWIPVEIKIGFQPILGQCTIFKILPHTRLTGPASGPEGESHGSPGSMALLG